MFDANAYLILLLSLLPTGFAWAKEYGSFLYRLMDGISQEFARVDARGMQLIEEADPRTTTELLADWERVFGLPDECSQDGMSIEQRREAIVRKFTMQGSLSRAFFIAQAAALGYVITITEFRPFRAGRSSAGDSLTNGPWRFTWQVNSAENTIRTFQAGLASAGDPLRSWGNETLECVIEKIAPAETVVLFAYE